MKIWALSSGSYSDYQEGPFFLKYEDALEHMTYVNERCDAYDTYSEPHEIEVHEEALAPEEANETFTMVSSEDGDTDSSLYIQYGFSQEEKAGLIANTQANGFLASQFITYHLNGHLLTRAQLIQAHRDEVAKMKYLAVEEGR